MARLVQRFEVSLKAFIVRDDAPGAGVGPGRRALFVREADTGFWELPGGRIDAGEEWHAHADVLAREMAEELGCGLRLRFGPEAVTWTRQRPWDGIFIFLVARIGWLECGEPVLSGEHMELAWLGPEAAEGLSFPPASGYRDAVRTLWRLVAQD